MAGPEATGDGMHDPASISQTRFENRNKSLGITKYFSETPIGPLGVYPLVVSDMTLFYGGGENSS